MYMFHSRVSLKSVLMYSIISADRVQVYFAFN